MAVHGTSTGSSTPLSGMLDRRPQCVDNGIARRPQAVDNGVADASTLGRLRAFLRLFGVIFWDRVGFAIPPAGGGTATGGMPALLFLYAAYRPCSGQAPRPCYLPRQVESAVPPHFVTGSNETAISNAILK